MIHPTAIISPEAKIPPDTRIGPYVIIEGPVTLGPGCILHAHAQLRGPLTMGARNVVHSTAVLGDWPQDRKFTGDFSQLIIGDDNIFREGVTIHRATGLNNKTIVGSRNYFMVNSHAGHNCVVGNDVTMVNGAVLGGHVHVADRAIIGAYSAIHQFCRIGRLVMVSNGANSTVDIPPFFISMETNHITQLNAVGLRRSGMPRESINAIRRLFQLAFRDNSHRPLSAALADLPPDLLAVPEVQELLTFCKTAKRGIALFHAWSQRHVSTSENIPEAL